MNWFQRYGIPGAYFLILFALWLFAVSPQSREILVGNPNIGALVGLAGLAFLPIGYVISIFGQWVYLKCKCLGIHREAAKTTNVISEKHRDDEWFLEARTLLLTALSDRISPERLKFIRDWQARRMDVISINNSLFIATFIAPFSAILSVCLCPELCFRFSGGVGAALSVLSLIVLVIMCCSKRVLREQVIETVRGVYRRFDEVARAELRESKDSFRCCRKVLVFSVVSFIVLAIARLIFRLLRR